MEETINESKNSQSESSELSEEQDNSLYPVMDIECILSELSSTIDNMRLEAATENIKLKVNSKKNNKKTVISKAMRNKLENSQFEKYEHIEHKNLNSVTKLVHNNE